MDKKETVFRLAKKLVRKNTENRDVVGAGCEKNNVRKIVVEKDKLLDKCSGLEEFGTFL